MSKAYIVCARRTPVGSFNGTLSAVAASSFGAEVVKDILNQTKLASDSIDEVIVGNVLPAGCGQGVGRQVSIKAGIPYEVPAYSLNMVCGSGMKAVINSCISIKSGFGNVYIAGGTENMSAAPYVVPEARQGLRMGEKVLVDHMVYDALTDAYNNYHMGITAENVAEKHNISRQEQDEFAIASQEKAVKAVDSGAFKAEITSVSIKQRKESIIFDTDEYPNRKTSYDKLASLRPAFKKDGTVTAGNSSGINDGAAFLLVVSEEAVKKYGLTPLAEVTGFGQGGVDPAYMGLGPVPAIANALKMASLSLKDISILELNEAFAAQSLGVVKELSEQHGVDKSEIINKTNLNGGAIAIGHPVGASGARIIVTLLHLMKSKNVEYGLASLCIGGGMGTAVILKNV